MQSLTWHKSKREEDHISHPREYKNREFEWKKIDVEKKKGVPKENVKKKKGVPLGIPKSAHTNRLLKQEKGIKWQNK